MTALRRVPFSLPLKVPVLTVTTIEGVLIEGPAGWGVCAPLPSWNQQEREAAERAAIEAATLPFPEPRQAEVEINYMVPRIPPDDAARRAVESGCSTIKIKVGDPDGLQRVQAVRAALPSAHIRLDTNGGWTTVDEAVAQLRQFEEMDIQYVEDPIGRQDDPEWSMRQLAALKQRIPIPLGAEMCIRTVDDARLFARLTKSIGPIADVFIFKVQRIGGICAALEATEIIGLPTVSSSALEPSTGLDAVLAVAAALDKSQAPFAHGIGTASLLKEDVTKTPLIPVNGILIPRRVAPDPEWLMQHAPIQLA